MICKNLTVVSDRLLFAGRDLRELADKYGTPLYLMDEDRIREKCRIYRQAMQEAFGENSTPVYASKACSFRRMYSIMREENMGIEVVSSGEIYTAKIAGADLSEAYFNGNNKTDADIAFAMESGVGYFVVDNEEEIDAIGRIAAEKGITQQVLLRITPGIDTHTYEAIQTGQVDSKFGSAIETGQAMAITKKSLETRGVKLVGFHCHVGSLVFDSDTFLRSADIMFSFMNEVRAETGFVAQELSLGGGYGVRYTESDPELDLRANILLVGKQVDSLCKRFSYPKPKIILEPGRSIVADAGLTLYTVGTVKRIPGYKTYVSVDGGMTDNPRFALYGAIHVPVLPEKMGETEKMICSVVGRCCESGDILCEGASLPSRVERGDLLAVLTTGAYNYSMASHYNRIPKPPVVMLSDGKDYVAVRRESYEDLTKFDL
ncbi:MAG: diaminopimelate decarboxylase [Ruminococcaceae bacterium]|nr:diaminopimelate decarboxylase [Oscillospiraceae bacterium]